MQRSAFSYRSVPSRRIRARAPATAPSLFHVREALTVFFYVLLCLILLTIFTVAAYAAQSYPCKLKAVDRTVTICTPSSSAILDSPVRVVAGTLHSQPVTLMQIYVDGKKVFEASGDIADTNLNLVPGTHRVTAQALDAKGFYSSSVQVTIKNALVPRFAYSAANDGTISAYTIHLSTGQPRANGYAVGDSSSSDAVVSWGRFLYVANGPAGTVSAFTISTGGQMTPVEGSPFRCGNDCRGIAIHPSGKYLFVTDAGEDLVRTYGINAERGYLFDSSYQETGRQPHSVAVDPGGRFVYVTNYADGTVSAYTIANESGYLVQMTGSPFSTGANPTRVTIDRTARFLAVANSGSNSVSIFFLTGSGALKRATGSPVAVSAMPNAVALYPSGSFLYVAHPAEISAYKIAFSTGALTLAGRYGANSAKALTVDSQGKFLQVVNSGSPAEMWIFRINQTSGKLSLAYKTRTRGSGAALALSAGKIAVTYAPRFLYVGSANTQTRRGSIAGFVINSTGTLTGIPGSPFVHQTGATSLAVHPNGKYLYAPGSQRESWRGLVIQYLINSTTGALSTGQVLEEMEPLQSPAMAVDPSGRFAYSPSSPEGEPALFGWLISPITGELGQWLFYALGPRYEHISIDPTGKFAYFVEAPETNVKTIDSRDGHWSAEYAMELRPFRATAVDPSGQFVFGVDETNNIVASNRVNGTTGKLTEVWAASTGVRPSAVTADPYGRFVFVINNGSGSVSVYKLNGTTGSLVEIPESPFATGLYPIQVTVEASGRYLYVANTGTRDISAYSINGSTGALIPLPGSPFATGLNEPLTSLVSVGVTK